MPMGLKVCHLLLSLILMDLSKWVNGAEQVPCYFIFGDSLWDNGNNNALSTKAKANYPPYGIDFPEGATGRFTNGRNMGDILAQLLGFENFIPSFTHASNAKDQEILIGVNYASGGAGIRNETARNNLGPVISMDMQLQNHQNTASRIAKILGNSEKSAAKHLSKCIYSVGVGNNDYINNYLLPQFYPTNSSYTPDQYATVLIQQYSLQLKTLYNFGARKVALFGLGLIGCTPGSIAMYGNGTSCVEYINNEVQMFNTKLVSLVDELNNNFQDTKFIYVNTSSVSSSIPATVINTSPCCEVGNLTANNGVLTCIPSGTACPNRAEHIMWDAAHPTETAYVMMAERSYKAQLPFDTYPIDIHHLAQLNLTN
ncbi:hypothetical protein AB3S75_003118 [Citrus x aurantiifolia]